jgi:hypothetical protein
MATKAGPSSQCAQQLADLVARVEVDDQHQDVDMRGRRVGDRPHRLDHAADALEVVDEALALVVGRMNHLHPEVSEVAKNVVGHSRRSRLTPAAR